MPGPSRPAGGRCDRVAGTICTSPLSMLLASNVRTTGALAFEAAGDQQRGFGQAVAGIKGFAAETAGLERFGEALERFGADRLGAVERDRPTAQIELGPLLGRDLANAQIVGEVRPAADRGPRGARWLAASGTAAARSSSATSTRWAARRRSAAECRRPAPCRGSWGARTCPCQSALTRRHARSCRSCAADSCG